MKPCPWPAADLLPHAGNMVLLDEICAYDETRLEAAACVRPGVFSEPDGALPAWLGLELMAQAVGAWAGCQSLEAGEQVKLGFLLGTRSYECHVERLPAGSRLTIKVERSFIDTTGMSVFHCELHDNERLLAQARLNVFQPADANAFIQETFAS